MVFMAVKILVGNGKPFFGSSDLSSSVQEERNSGTFILRAGLSL
jgi:hypothetical protein